jgi:hypothetical protein
MHQIVCLKWGKKYPADYVNKLYSMVGKQFNAPFSFFCITDDSTGLADAIQIITLPEQGLTGWWNKMWLFSPEFPLEGTCLFLDLDIVIAEPIDCFFEYQVEKKFCSIRDFVRDEFNTSVIRWEAGCPELVAIWHQFTRFVDQLENSKWEKFKKHLRYLRRRFSLKSRKRIKSKRELTQLGTYKGSQKWLSEKIYRKPWVTQFPEGWCFSYKWGVQKSQGVAQHQEGTWLEGGCIAIFEGKPKPHECMDVPWVAKHWG